MNKTVFLESEKYWRSPDFDTSSLSLGEEILRNLNKSDPDKVFEILHDSDSHVTFKEIYDQTITVAQNLLNLGVKQNDTVVVLTKLNLKITPLTFAFYTIGAPVCFFDTYLQQEFVSEYLSMLDPMVIIYEEKFKPMVLDALKVVKLPKLQHLLTLDGIEDGLQKSVDELLFRPTVDSKNFKIPSIGDPRAQPAILGFTSGTTGLPKIIINSHEMMKHSVYSLLRSEPGSIIMVLSEIRWLCQVCAMMQPAFLDVTRVYSSKPLAELTGEFVCKLIDNRKVTHYFEVPKFYRTVLEAADRLKNSLSSLKMVSLTGEIIAPVFDSYLKTITPNCVSGRCYGMTDIGGVVASSEFSSRRNVNGGILRNGMMVKIIDRSSKPLGPNEMGQICLKPSVPFLGYLKNEMANKYTFTQDGWFKTGDLGMMDSDNLLIAFTRQKFVLKYADGRILLPNIIENIVEQFEGVKSSALVGTPSAENPKQDRGTVFVVVNNNNYSETPADFENRLKEYLKRELTPEQLQIVKYLKIIEELPRTTCFKVDRLALKDMCDGYCII